MGILYKTAGFFEAQCMFCKYKICYTDHYFFRKHIALHHEKILKYEKGRKLKNGHRYISGIETTYIYNVLSVM